MFMLFGVMRPSLWAVVLSGLSPADAASIDWEAPDGCPSRAEVVAGVERALGRPLADERLSVAAEISREDELWVLELRLVSAEGEQTRIWKDPRCDLLTEAAVLAIAVGLDPAHASTDRPSAPDDPVEPPTRLPEPPVLPPPPRSAPDTSTAKDLTPSDDVAAAGTHVDAETPSRSSPEGAASRDGDDAATRRRDAAHLHCQRGRAGGLCLGLAASARVQYGPMPVGPGVSGTFAVMGPRWRVEVGGSHWFTRSAREPDDPDVGADLRLTTGFAEGCFRAWTRVVEFPLCAGLEVGSLHGLGVGVDTRGEDRLRWIAGIADLKVGWSPVRHLGLLATVGAVVPMGRYRFQIGGVGTVYEVPPIGVRGAITVEARFP